MRPIGYWVKEIDRRLEDDVDRLLEAEHLTRRHWQVLDTLARAETQSETRGPAHLDAALAPFAATVQPQVDDLRDRGWVTATGPVALTGAGRAAHNRVAAQVRDFRAHVTDGLSEQDYRTLITLLERIAGNLTPT